MWGMEGGCEARGREGGGGRAAAGPKLSRAHPQLKEDGK